MAKLDLAIALRLAAELNAPELPHTAKLFGRAADELEALRAENKRLKAQRPDVLSFRPADLSQGLQNYGQLAELFTAMKKQGWSKASVDYCRHMVWHEL
jgi:hypothetical protein